MTNSLTLEQARKLVLLSQRVLPTKQNSNPLTATLSAIEHLGYIQIDTISAIQRAHHHTLWNRNPNYKISHLEELISNKDIFEYWSHAAAYLPMSDYRHSLPRKEAFLKGTQKHWYTVHPSIIKMVHERIRKEGPLMAKDFKGNGVKTGEWKSKPAKQALEYLFMQGDIMISSRSNFHKVYDLTERVLPAKIDTSIPTPQEHSRFLIKKYLNANGLGQATEISYLLKNTKPLITTTLQEMFENQELQQIKVKDTTYFSLPHSLNLLNKQLPKQKLKILSPFDNLLIQRKRMQSLFNFEYLIECYLPQTKRQYGYFSLPLLWNGQLVARVDCKADRKKSVLHLQHLALEPQLTKTEAFIDALQKELSLFLEFNNCHQIQVHKTTPSHIQSMLKTSLPQN